MVPPTDGPSAPRRRLLGVRRLGFTDRDFPEDFPVLRLLISNSHRIIEPMTGFASPSVLQDHENLFGEQGVRVRARGPGWGSGGA